MAFVPIPEYEGKSPYVFITYAQQDERIAYSIAVKMYNEGFRIWSSAACGNPSNMRIAERLSNSEVAMVFLSRSYLKYASYKEFEPRAVMNSPKQKIVICLDDTPIGTDWNTVDFPAGIRYDPAVPASLWLRINSSDTLEKCRGAWPRVSIPMPFEEKTAAPLDEADVSRELDSLNSVMTSFGAGLDDDEIRNISLFQPQTSADRFRWPEKQEPTQEQEYYAIENLIGSAPVMSPEKKQYDSMIGLIEGFMEKSSRAREDARRTAAPPDETQPVGMGGYQKPSAPSRNSYGSYRSVPKNEFDRVDLTKDTASEPVVITQSSDIQRAQSAFAPITLDYGEETGSSDYGMTRSGTRPERFPTPEVPAEQPPAPPEEKKKPQPKPEEKTPPRDPAPVFEKIVDSRKLMTSTEENADNARLTYHLGSAFDGFDERDFMDDAPSEPEPPKPEPPKPEPPKPEPPKPEPPKPDDGIPQPALRFDKPHRPLPSLDFTPPATADMRRTLSKPRRRYIVSVRRGVRRIEYDSEMYEVNGRWIPADIYHRLMPNAAYTAIRHINHPRKPSESTASTPTPAYQPPSDNVLNAGNRLFGTGGYTAPPAREPSSSGYADEALRAPMRGRHESRRQEAIRQYEEQQTAAAPAAKPPAQPEGENQPARKHRFSHEGGIKKSLLTGMETPVNTDAEESHRQYGARAESVKAEADAAPEKGGKPDKKSRKEDDKSAKKAAQKAAQKAALKKEESKKND